MQSGFSGMVCAVVEEDLAVFMSFPSRKLLGIRVSKSFAVGVRRELLLRGVRSCSGVR